MYGRATTSARFLQKIKFSKDHRGKVLQLYLRVLDVKCCRDVVCAMKRLSHSIAVLLERAEGIDGKLDYGKIEMIPIGIS